MLGKYLHFYKVRFEKVKEMKNKILDDAFLSPNIFSNYIKEEESIIWQGNPSERYQATMFEGNKKNRNEIVKILLGLFGFSIVLIFYFNNPISKNAMPIYFFFMCWFLLFITSFGFIYSEYQMSVLKKNTKYAITDNWILLNKQDSFDDRIGMIGFFEIDSCSILLDKNGVKTFSIKTTSPKYSLDCYDFESGKKRKNITLELIEDFEIVEELLQKGIEKYKKT